MIEFTHAYKTYSGNIQALKNINLTVQRGEFVFLTGPSGAGKTTLFKLLSAYDRPTTGKVNVSGYDIGTLSNNRIPIFRRNLGVIYQDFRLIKSKNIFDNIALPLEIRGERDRYIHRRVEEILDQVGLSHKRNAYPEFLSGGEQQRVAIARAIIHHPEVLIADEPTGNLDPDLAKEIIELMDKINSQGTTVFIATHDHDLVKSRNNRVIEIRNGVLVRTE